MAKKVRLSNFKHIEVNIDYADIIHKYAEECVEILKDLSPRRSTSQSYADGWTIEEKKDVYQRWYYCTIWNKTDWQLTHLLENGHLIVNKRGGVGWASKKPHIEKSYRRIRNPLIRDIENMKTDVNIE